MRAEPELRVLRGQGAGSLQWRHDLELLRAQGQAGDWPGEAEDVRVIEERIISI